MQLAHLSESKSDKESGNFHFSSSYYLTYDENWKELIVFERICDL